jgi:multidrug efflux pump subunit AcrB
MWIVRLALQRPYTFVVLSLVLVLSGVQVIRRTPTDVLPSVDVPVISVVWTYNGLPAQQMESQVTQFSEFSIASNTTGIQRLQSNTYDGISVIRVFLQPTADVSSALAQITAVSQTIVRRMPPGIIPPIIVRYTASSVPVLQLAFTNDTLSEAELFDHVNNRVRTALSVIPGTQFPLPQGGKFRQISVDLNLESLKANGLSPQDVALAVSAQNLTLPTGTLKLGEREYRVGLNSTPEAISALNELPVRRPDGKLLQLRDVAFVHDGFQVQTNIARNNGRRSVVLTVMKTGEASTLDVASRIKSMIPTLQAAAPAGTHLQILSDASGFVSHSIEGLLIEGLIAAALTAAMILIFLGSWRSTLIVVVSIPLSVVVALLLLRALGYTLNAMTLGGLALAVGILVDDATVEIENIHRNLSMGKPLTRAILDGAQQIAVPAFVASLSISVVFISVLFLEGPARYLFMPMGLAVSFSVMASYLLSRTLVPTMVNYLLPNELAHTHHGAAPSAFARVHARFEAGFESLRSKYLGLLQWVLSHRTATLMMFVALVAVSILLSQFVGRDYFPKIDSGSLRLHVTAPAGTRIEETERIFSEVEGEIRRLIPEEERLSILDFIGQPGGYNLALTDSANVSAADGEILVALSERRTQNARAYESRLRDELSKKFPALRFYFQPADVVTQILNFGLPSAIDIQVAGQRRDATYAAARKIEHQLRAVRGAVDVRLHQVVDAPKLHLEVDRLRAADVGLTQRDVANNVLLAVSSSSQVSPTFWTDPKTGFGYAVAVQVPEVRVDSLEALTSLGVQTSRGQQLLGDLSALSRQQTPVFTTRVDVQPTFQVRADAQNVDLGTVARSIEKIAAEVRKDLPPGSTIEVRGQIESMSKAFDALFLGLLAAALLVYAVMVINFQSWVDPFIIISALPGAGIGIVWAHYVTQITLSIPSLMGAILSVGVATANSILVVTFANEQRPRGLSALEAAIEAGKVRLRPVLMTAMAMVMGLLPMSLGFSEGGEQNAALGRAMLGGIFGATFSTLFIVPLIYTFLRREWQPRRLDEALVEASESTVKAA